MVFKFFINKLHVGNIVTSSMKETEGQAFMVVAKISKILFTFCCQLLKKKKIFKVL